MVKRELAYVCQLAVAAGVLMTPILLLAAGNAHWPQGLANRSGPNEGG